MSWWKNTSYMEYIVFVVTGIPWMYQAVKYFWRKRTKCIEKRKDDSNTSEYEILMFEEDKCKLCNLLGNAEKTLDICVSFITAEDIIGSILLASQRGARVRIITDVDMMQFAPQLEILENNGILIHKEKNGYEKHHKFAVVDNKVLIEGSANWTMQAFTRNWKYMIISTNKTRAERLADIFTDIWDTCEEEERQRMEAQES